MNDEDTAEHDEYMRQSASDAETRVERLAGPKQDVLIRFLLIMTAAVTIITLGVGAITAPYIISGANNSDQVVTGNNLNACRSQLSAKVTDARTTVDEARTGYEVALGDVAQQLGARGDVTVALAAMVTAADDIAVKTKALRDATTEYLAAVKLSSSDPAKFLATYCT